MELPLVQILVVVATIQTSVLRFTPVKLVELWRPWWRRFPWNWQTGKGQSVL